MNYFDIRLFIRHYRAELVLFLLALVPRFIIFTIEGVQPGGDSAFYIQQAQIILDHGGNIFALSQSGTPFYYWLYPTVLALFNINVVSVVLFQIFVDSLGVIFVYRIGRELAQPLTGIIAGLIYCVSIEIFHWTLYILTDSLFVFSLIFSVYCNLRAFKSPTLLRYLFLIISIIMVIFLRPTALPFMCALGLLWTSKLKRNYQISLILVGVAALLLLFYLAVFRGPQRPFTPSASVAYYQSLYHRGIIVRDRPELTIPTRWDTTLTWHNVGEFLKITKRRMIVFWYITAKGFSPAHSILNDLLLLPLYVGAGVSLIQVLRRKIYQPIFWFLITIIISYWLFQSVTEVDYDWRYRVPVLPFLILIASYGFSSIITKHYPKMASTFSKIV